MKLTIFPINLIWLLASLVSSKTTNVTSFNQVKSCESWTEDFSKGLGQFITEGQASVINNKLVMKISLGNTPNPTTGVIMGYGAKVSSKNKVHFGTISARIKTSRIGGVVTALVILSPEKDEIDWEWVGKDEFSSQTNYYVKGIIDYTKGLYIQNTFNTHADFHDYSIKWTPNEIIWSIDGNPVRSINKNSLTGGFPDTSSNIHFSLWDGGSNAPGTRDWAGGLINWKDPEYVKLGYMSAEVDSISYQCL